VLDGKFKTPKSNNFKYFGEEENRPSVSILGRETSGNFWHSSPRRARVYNTTRDGVSPPLLDPVLDSISNALHLVHSLVITHLTVSFARLDEARESLSDHQVVVGYHGILLFILPDQVSDISCGNGYDVVGAGDGGDEGYGGTEKDVSVSGNDGTGHGGHGDVDGTGQQFLSGFFGRG